MDASRSTRRVRGRTRRWVPLPMALLVVAGSWSIAAADNLPMKLISPDVKQPQPLNSTFDLKVQTEPNAECMGSIGYPFNRTLTLPKQTANSDGYVVWSVETGGESGSRSAWVTCDLNGRKGSLAFAYRQ
jgi:hypothetical protein